MIMMTGDEYDDRWWRAAKKRERLPVTNKMKVSIQTSSR